MLLLLAKNKHQMLGEDDAGSNKKAEETKEKEEEKTKNVQDLNKVLRW